MKKIIIFISLIGIIGSSCKKTILDQVNPNEPTVAALATEGGITNFALGIYRKWVVDLPGYGGEGNLFVISSAQHSIMGDEWFIPYGNEGNRWLGQTYSVKLPNGTVVVNPNNQEQKAQIQALNSRAAYAADQNPFVYEWIWNYLVLGQANQLYAASENPGLSLTGNVDVKKKTFKAWALWWRGFAYSRLGSLYLAGVVNNSTLGTNDLFVDHNALITEANKNFEECAALLATIPDDSDDYSDVMNAITPTVFSSGVATSNFKNGFIKPSMWLRQIYTYEARNFLVNKKVKDMSNADWTALLTLTSKGLQPGDNTFNYSLDPTLTNDLNGLYLGNGSTYAYFGTGNQFSFSSERLIQDFKPGDARFTKSFTLLDTADWAINIRSRGLQFGTRWDPIAIEDGGLYATNNNVGIINIACTWDENALMTAEAKIRSGADIEGGLALIDAVRASQGAGLAPVAGTSLTQSQAIEELRKERRIGLFLRGLAFFDARRWGVTEPVSTGGGRNNANVLVPGTYTLSGKPEILPTQIDYRYLDYLDVPAIELDFNAPSSSSAPVKN